MSKMEEELNKLRDISCSRIGRLTMVKISMLSNFIYSFNAITIKIPANYFMNISKNSFLILYGEAKGPEMSTQC